MQTEEAMFGDSTSQVAPKLAFDKWRSRTLARLLTCEERFQLFGDDAVQYGLFRLARNIFKRSLRHAKVLSSTEAGIESAVLRELALRRPKCPGFARQIRRRQGCAN